MYSSPRLLKEAGADEDAASSPSVLAAMRFYGRIRDKVKGKGKQAGSQMSQDITSLYLRRKNQGEMA
jgi:hypothetical protein